MFLDKGTVEDQTKKLLPLFHLILLDNRNHGEYLKSTSKIHIEAQSYTLKAGRYITQCTDMLNTYIVPVTRFIEFNLLVASRSQIACNIKQM